MEEDKRKNRKNMIEVLNKELKEQIEKSIEGYNNLTPAQKKEQEAKLSNVFKELKQSNISSIESFLKPTIPQIIEPPKKEVQKPTGKFKKSGHLTDQLLKYDYPKEKASQLTIWEQLGNETQHRIEEAEVERSEVVEGIKLTASETKVMDSLCKLLHKNSETHNELSENYYTGNLKPEIVPYTRTEQTPAPKLACTLYELTKEYKGGDKVSGKDVDNVKAILSELNEKKFLIRYTETTKGKRGKGGGIEIKKEIEQFRSLIHVDKATLTITKGGIAQSKKSEIIILLHPIIRRQIDSKFILYPNDIIKRTAIAYGSHNVSEVTMRLREYLMREHSANRHTPQIRVEKLYYMLNEKYMKESRKGKVKKQTDKALDIMKAIGLLESYEIKEGVTGEPIMHFKLNKDFE